MNAEDQIRIGRDRFIDNGSTWLGPQVRAGEGVSYRFIKNDAPQFQWFQWAKIYKLYLKILISYIN